MTVEDMDLVVRAHLQGWKFIFLNDVRSLYELPDLYEAYRKQLALVEEVATEATSTPSVEEVEAAPIIEEALFALIVVEKDAPIFTVAEEAPPTGFIEEATPLVPIIGEHEIPAVDSEGLVLEVDDKVVEPTTSAKANEGIAEPEPVPAPTDVEEKFVEVGSEEIGEVHMVANLVQFAYVCQ